MYESADKQTSGRICKWVSQAADVRVQDTDSVVHSHRKGAGITLVDLLDPDTAHTTTHKHTHQHLRQQCPDT